ncbi:MAG: putative toxin-antitoxin system toxin component, PIN family [Thermomicrobia bacterium]|nr:putative toxin-antitoxin system toxin component, PIN family [Thermomicrobia bacterium]
MAQRCAQYVPSSMYSIVLDTVIFVRSLINPSGLWGGSSSRMGRYRLITSEAIAVEILEELRRPELAREYCGVASANYQIILDILAHAEAVTVEDIPAVSRDPKDDKFLATAMLAGAQYLVSEDQDLLVLREYAGVRIVDALTFLRLHET